ncbi:MAG: helix-turn-helix transcriptional regulator [Oscillospiraceae bacterium]|nr:helix-turn-helix transcriptional regulator [Oscillospiraceae bacterium]
MIEDMNVNFSVLFSSFGDLEVTVDDTKFTFITDIRLLDLAYNKEFWEMKDQLFRTLKLENNDTRKYILHIHPYYEMFVVNKDSVRLQLRDSTIILNQNDLCIIPPGVYHYIEDIISIDEGIKDSVYNLGFSFSYEIDSSGSNIYNDFRRVFCGSEIRVKENRHDFCEYMVRLKECLNKGSKLKTQKLRAILSDIMFELYDTFDGGSKEAVKTVVEGGNFKLSHIHKINYIISNFYMNDLTLEKLSEILHISPRQISRIIKKEYGMTFKECLVETRIQNIIKMYHETGSSLEALAEAAGYDSMNGFYHAFRNYTGCTPAKYFKRSEQK